MTNEHPVSLQQRIVNLMQEAAGTKPVDNSGPRSVDNLVRNTMRDILEESDEDEKAQAGEPHAQAVEVPHGFAPGDQVGHQSWQQGASGCVSDHFRIYKSVPPHPTPGTTPGMAIPNNPRMK